ncbi:MAG: alanine racemase [Rubricoccaceae bacterium]|nr:alanine racemase [Rubricoccaceae bacterium]
MFEPSTIELSRVALSNNLQMVRQLLNDNTVLSSVIKGNAYGHGIREMVGLLQAEGVDHFSVFNAEEAYDVHPFLRSEDCLMIMGDVESDALAWAIEHDVHFFVFDLKRLNEAMRLAEHIGKAANLHLEVETGMNRTGFPPDDFKEAVELIKANKSLASFSGLCTHFAGAESISNYHRVQSQIRKYRRAVDYCSKVDATPSFKHTCCSAGVLRYPRMTMDLVRVGILQYGHWPSTETLVEYMTKNKCEENPLKRVLSWKSRLMSTKDVKTGQFVGYGSSYLAMSDIRIGIVPIGYAYGYSRILSNQGHVLIHGKRAPVIGTINMNALTVDITDVPEAKKGDEVILIGRSGSEAITVSSFGELSRQLNYELLTRLPSNIPRHVVN